MEYTFKNSPRENAFTVTLSDYTMTVRSSGKEMVIPYASITRVRLCKVSGAVYKMVLHRDDHVPLVISNQSFSNDSKNEDQSRMYSTFVRVLHYHLKDKSTAVYTSGCGRETLWKWIFISVVLSFVISFTADFLGLNLLNPYAGAAILAVLTIPVLFLLCAGQLPKPYSSTNIPLNLLP